MTYKWEAIAQDLTEERDRLLKENERLRKALEDIRKRSIRIREQKAIVGIEANFIEQVAIAALKSEKQ